MAETAAHLVDRVSPEVALAPFRHSLHRLACDRRRVNDVPRARDRGLDLGLHLNLTED
jgi:hypothetical protein